MKKSEVNNLCINKTLEKTALQQQPILEGNLTGYPSIDKPWLKYYNQEAVDTSVPEMTMYDYLYERNKNNLDDIAIEYYDRKITYRELFYNVEKATKAFASMGIKNNSIVGICSITTPEVIYSIYALNRLGAIANLIDPRTNGDKIVDWNKSNIMLVLNTVVPKISAIANKANIDTIVVISPLDSLTQKENNLIASDTEKIVSELKNDQGVKCLSWSNVEKLAITVDKIEFPKFKKNHGAVIVYTGGTTGVPKGAILSNEGFIASVINEEYAIPTMTRNTSFLNIMPPFIAYGLLFGINAPLTIGSRVRLIPNFDVNHLSDYIMDYKPNHVMGVPSFWEKMCDDPKMKDVDLSFLKSITAGGDSMKPSVQIKINKFLIEHNSPNLICNGYGMTEVSAATTYTKGNTNSIIGSVGIPLVLNNMKVVIPNTETELKYDEDGEVCIQSPAMMVGYLNNEEATNDTIRKHADGKLWVHSHDIGRITQDGFVFIRDRIKRMIVRPDGHNVFPSEIEKVIMSHYAVDTCVVVGETLSEENGGKYPVAFIKIKPQYLTKKNEIFVELSNLCMKNLPKRETPCEYFCVDSIPYTNVGKVDYLKIESILKKLFNDNLEFKTSTISNYVKTLSLS